MNMKDQYWYLMYQKKKQVFYLDYYLAEYVFIKRVLKAILVLGSSGALATWAYSGKHPLICGAIIAFSQVISTVYEILPYKRRITDMSSLKAAWDSVYLLIESDYFYVDSDQRSDEEINDLIKKYNETWNSIDDKYFKDDALPELNRISKKANIKTKNYFANKYGEANDNEK